MNHKEHAAHGAKFYNASTEHEQHRWEVNALDGWADYLEGLLSQTAKCNLLDFYSLYQDFHKVFNAEMTKIGISVDELRMAMTMVYAAETRFGTGKMESPTGVVGPFQVTTATYEDLCNQGIIGIKAGKFLGTLVGDNPIRTRLRSYKGSFVAGTGKYLQTLM